MNSRIFSAYNESSKRQLATGIGIVDSVDEPIKVLKILMEGLAPASGSGIWITRFHGLPIARSYTPFDLIYLDDDRRVVHDVEITQTSNFVPFKGLPTSALILPPRSITSSKTFTGDRIALRVIETAPSPSENASGTTNPAQAAPPPASGAPSGGPRRLNITFELVEEASPAPVSPTTSEGVLKPAKRTPNTPPDSQTSITPAAAGDSNVPQLSVEPEGILKRPKKRRFTPVPVVENAPPSAVETDSQAFSAPPAADSASPAPVANEPATPAPAAPEPEFAAASAEPISVEAALLATEPVSIDPPPEPPVALVSEAPSPVAPFSEPPAPVALGPEALAPADTSDVPVESSPIESSQLEKAPPPAIAQLQLSALDPPKAPLEVHEDTAPFAVDEPLHEESSLILRPPSDEETLPQAASGDSPESEPESEIPTALDKPQQQKAMDIARRWDVKLLYSVFPELHPSYRPELTMPSVDPLKYLKSEHDDEKLSAKLQLLSWLYPELELETIEQRQRSQRRAPRIDNPGLVGYFYSSGKAEPHEIRNFSVTGFYMKTDERWLPGTVIRITLQMVDTDGSNPGDTLTLHSRVVNWDEHGGGFEFVLPGFLE